MAEAGQPQVDLAQPVEEEEPRLDGRMLELPLDEFERGERAHRQEPPAGGRAGQQRAPFLRRQRRRARFRREDVRDDGHELVVPAAQACGIAPAEGGKRVDGFADVGPPFERAAVAGDERDVELGLDQLRAAAREVEIGVPRHGGDGAQEEGMGIVAEAGAPRVFDRAQAAAGGRTALDRQRLEPRLAEIGLQDEAVVPGAENDAVVSGHAMRAALRASRVERPT